MKSEHNDSTNGDPEPILSETDSPSMNQNTGVPNERLKWIDYMRGFIMVFLVVTLVFPPDEWKPEGSVMFFLFGHPSATATYMTLFDVGAAAFIFIIGLTTAISFKKHEGISGIQKAVQRYLIRYGLISILALILLLASGNLIVFKNGYNIVAWDVLPSIALTGFITLPFIFIDNPKIRIICGYLWLLIYQILMLEAGLKEYAQASVHGGIFGTIFGYSGINIIASGFGQYIFQDSTAQKKKYQNMAVFGFLNLLGGIIISYVPAWEAAKRQVSFTHCVISIGVTILGGLLFVFAEKRKINLMYLEAFGRNPFLTYLIAELPAFIIGLTVGEDLGMGPVGNVILMIILLSYTSILMLVLYKKKKLISTEKIALIFILIGIPVAIIGVALDIF